MGNGKTGKRRRGFTTGTCAAAAARAAALMLLTGQETDRISLQWQPVKDQYVTVEFAIENTEIGQDSVRCAVRKDAGDDVDVTDGLLIYAKVSHLPDFPEPFSHEEKERLVLEEKAETTVLNEEIEEKEGDAAGNDKLADDPVFPDAQSSLTLSDLENDQGVIPMRWDKVADFFAPKQEQKTTGRRLIALNDNGEFTESEWVLMQELFQAAGEPDEQAIDRSDNVRRVLSEQERFPIAGGEGIGIVKKEGLDQPPGEAAINSGPRRMIRNAVASICEACEYEGRLMIEISAPGGEQTASRTFNPRLGIEGGLSILGTTGIVEPMSGRAVAETVRAEVRVKAAESDVLVFVPGNTGASFVRQELLIPETKTVIVSNYPGDALDEAREAGVRKVLLAGSLGKMVKLAGGVFYTHSRDADVRIDIMMRCSLRAGASIKLLRRLEGCVTTDAALDLLEQDGLLDAVAEELLNRAQSYVSRRAEEIETELILLRNSGDVIAFTENAFSILGTVV